MKASATTARLALAFALVVAGLLVAALVFRSKGSKLPLESAAPGPTPLQEEPASPAAEGKQGPAGSVEAASEERLGHRSEGLRGRVEDAESRPIADAAITLSAIPSATSDYLRMWKLVDEEALSATTLSRNSDAEGAFSFASVPADEGLGVVLWVTAPGHLAEWRWFESTGIQDVSLRLLRARPLEVRVVDPTGAPQAGAEVHMIAVRPGSPGGTQAKLAWKACRRWATTKADGTALFGALPGRVALQARLGDLASATAIADAPFEEEMLLTLAPVFHAFGQVIVESGQPRSGVVVIEQVAVENGMGISFDEWRASPDLSWGPVDVPVSSAEEQHFSVRGGGLFPTTVAIPTPAAGESVRVDIRTREGFDLDVRVRDDSGNPVEDALVSFYIQREEGDVELTGRTGSDGKAVLEGCIPTSGWLSARARGHAEPPVRSELVDRQSGELEIVLQRAGMLRGRATHAGKPLEDFTVLYWQGDPHAFRSKEVTGSTEGEFTVEDAPLGMTMVLAHTDLLPQSPAQPVEIPADGEGFVEIEVPAGLRGRGSVVAAHTGDPVPDAEVQLWSSYGSKLIARVGSPVRCSPRGEFEVERLAPGENRFEVSAPGFGTWYGVTFAKDEAVSDLGTVSLTRTQTLTLKLVDAPAEADLRAFSVSGEGSGQWPLQAFDGDGVAQYEGMVPNNLLLRVKGPGFRHAFNVQLVSGMEWTVEIRLGGSRSLEVFAVPAPGRDLPSDLDAVLVCPGSIGSPNETTVPLEPGGRASFPCVPCESGVVELRQRQRTLAVAPFRSEGPEAMLRIEVPARWRRGVVLDVQGTAVPNAEVGLLARDASPRILTWYEADGNGRFEFPEPPTPELLGFLYKSGVGWSASIEARVPASREDLLELELDPSAALRLRFQDGATPVPGLTVLAQDPLRVFELVTQVSDSGGHVRFDAISEGVYHLKVVHPEVWPVELDAEAKQRPEAQVVQVRRLAGLTVDVLTPLGAPVAAAEVVLISEEFGETVEAWMSAGRVPSSPLLTDGAGSVRVERIPNGTYSWTVRREGESNSGVVSVPPWGTGNLKVKLP